MIDQPPETPRDRGADAAERRERAEEVASERENYGFEGYTTLIADFGAAEAARGYARGKKESALIARTADHDCAWKDAIIDAAIVDWIFTREHETNPRKAVNDLLVWQQALALDPAVSKGAADLYARGYQAALSEGSLLQGVQIDYDCMCSDFFAAGQTQLGRCSIHRNGRAVRLRAVEAKLTPIAPPAPVVAQQEE